MTPTDAILAGFLAFDTSAVYLVRTNRSWRKPRPAASTPVPADSPRIASLADGFSVAEVALRTGWSKSALKEMCAAGRLATVGKTAGGQWVIDRKAAEALPVRGQAS